MASKNAWHVYACRPYGQNEYQVNLTDGGVDYINPDVYGVIVSCQSYGRALMMARQMAQDLADKERYAVLAYQDMRCIKIAHPQTV